MSVHRIGWKVEDARGWHMERGGLDAPLAHAIEIELAKVEERVFSRDELIADLLAAVLVVLRDPEHEQSVMREAGYVVGVMVDTPPGVVLDSFERSKPLGGA